MRYSRNLAPERMLPSLFFYWIFSSTAPGYLDPGTGSYVLQIILAALLGGLVAIKIFWARIRSFFANLFQRGNREE